MSNSQNPYSSNGTAGARRHTESEPVKVMSEMVQSSLTAPSLNVPKVFDQEAVRRPNRNMKAKVYSVALATYFALTIVGLIFFALYHAECHCVLKAAFYATLALLTTFAFGRGILPGVRGAFRRHP